MGDPDAALDVLGAEFLEVEDGRGISVFVGNGHCLDHKGNQYTAFEKADITTTRVQERAQTTRRSEGSPRGSAPGVWWLPNPCRLGPRPYPLAADAPVRGRGHCSHSFRRQ